MTVAVRVIATRERGRAGSAVIASSVLVTTITYVIEFFASWGLLGFGSDYFDSC